MGRWKLEYYDEGWNEFTGTVQDITEELDGHEEVTIKIPNTAQNRTFVSTDQMVRIKFDDVQIYLGLLLGVEYSFTELKCVLYNGVYEQLKRRVISADYVNIPADTVMEGIRLAAGLTNPLGSCPTTPITVSFDQTLCFDALKMVTDILNADYWTENGDTLYVGTRGSNQSFDSTIAKISTRGLDRSKKRDKAHVRGVTEDGQQIMGVAGTGDNVAVDWCHNATTLDTLDALAARMLAEVNSDDSGVALTSPITSGVHLHPGDLISLDKPALNLLGTYRIKKTTKHRKTVEIEVSRAKKTTEDVLEELTKGNTEALSSGIKDAFSFDSWEALINVLGLFPKRGILWKDIWKYLPSIDKSLIPASDNMYDIGDPVTPLRWKAIFGVHVFPSYLGAYSDEAAVLQFWTKNKAGTEVVDHHFQPSDDAHGNLGAEFYRWLEMHSNAITAYDIIFGFRLKNQGDTNPLVALIKNYLEFGPGGESALDTWLHRVAAGEIEIKNDLVPTGDNAGKIGYGGASPLRWSEIHAIDIYASQFHYAGNLIPDADDIYDIGENSTPKRWRNVYLSGLINALAGLNIGTYTIISSARVLENLTAIACYLVPDVSGAYELGGPSNKWNNLYLLGFGDIGSLVIGGISVISALRVLQNVTADAAIITSGKFPLGRLPNGTSGYVLEAEGEAFDPMYVNPNGRYTPAGHNHAAGNITSGVLDEARCPNVYSGAIHFNGGIVTNSVNCANFSMTDLVFENDFRVMEAEKLGFPKGLAFLDGRGKILMVLDGKGNVQVLGRLSQRCRLKRLKRRKKKGFGA